MARELVTAKVSDGVLVAERHARLVLAATELFLEQGFHKTSVREIANAVGWQMGTLYLYISRKEDVLYLISQSVMTELWDGLRALPEKDCAREALVDASRYFFRAVDRKRREIKLIYRESASLGPDHLEVVQETELKERDLFASLIKKGIAAGEFCGNDVDLIAHDIIMLAHMWALKGWALHENLDLEAYTERQLNLVLGRLTPTA